MTNNCYNVGDVTGPARCGGVCGHVQADNTTDAYVTLCNNYNAGTVSGQAALFGEVAIADASGIYTEANYYKVGSHSTPYVSTGTYGFASYANYLTSFTQDETTCTLAAAGFGGSTNMLTALNAWRDQDGAAYNMWYEDTYMNNAGLPWFKEPVESGLIIEPSPVAMGDRPIGAWMHPVEVALYNNSGEVVSINGIDFENNNFYVNETGFTQPFTMNPYERVILNIGHNVEATPEAGEVIDNLVVDYVNRIAIITEISGNAYTPEVPDVVEMPQVVTSFPYVTTQGTSNIYDNYYLPGQNFDGPDAVYKLVITEEVNLNAAITEGEQAKLALYAEDFGGEPGPGLYNFISNPFEGTEEYPVSNGGDEAITNMTLTPGTYYLVASSRSYDFTLEINAEELPCPAQAYDPEPGDDADGISRESVTLRWALPNFTTEYRLVFGSTYYCEETLVDWTTDLATSYTVTDLYNNTNYFWRVDTRNSECETLGEVWGFTTSLNIPQNLRVADATIFEGQGAVLSWTAIQDRTYRYYNIYQDGDLIASTPANVVTTTYTVNGLTYNMGGYNFYVTAVYDEGESAPSNTVNVKVSGNGNVAGHVYEQDGETGIAGATVTFTGHDEFGDSQTFNFITDATGAYGGAIMAGEYDGQAACEGYQTITEPTCGNPVAIDFNNTTRPVDFVLDENFTPVCDVIAQYYPDSLDPASPYVKVYWGCGLPGSAIIEDFETGDFSQFDYNFPGSYPWEIVTTHPYEGTYCMKSGGTNVASASSSVEVTVDIPRDGLFSFYSYISCESSWDNGYYYMDGAQMGTVTGLGATWGKKEFAVTAGTHTFKWTYTKDSSVNSGEDAWFVDYIDFIHDPEPAQPGWHTYAEGELDNALGSNLTTTPSWGYLYPNGGGFAGMRLTKVALFSDNAYGAVGGNYTLNVILGGATPDEGTVASTMTVDVPSNQNAWVEWDLTTPVTITGNENVWVLWTANTTVSSWPAGMAPGSDANGSWWNGGNGWEQMLSSYGDVWTMKQYFTNRRGDMVADTYASAQNKVVAQTPNFTTVMPVKGETVEAYNVCNPSAIHAANVPGQADRAFSHYRVYRTNCYQESPYTEENTVVLACELQDTLYIDVEWGDLPAGVYKWGVGVVYNGNRESEITWSEPTVVPAQGEAAEATRDIIQIGEGLDNDPYVLYPTNTVWRYTLNEQILLASEIGTAGTINSISYYSSYNSGGFTSTVRNMDIYMKHTSKSVFTGNLDWDQVAASDLVYSGNIEFVGSNGWTTIELQTPFQYNGTDNLIIACDDNTGSYPGCIYFGRHNTGDNRGIVVISDTDNYNALSMASYTARELSAQTADIRLDITAGGSGSQEPIQEPRESEIVWSNCLDKDMYLDGDVTVNVLLNSADNPEGATVTFTNLNELEQELYPMDPIVIDETGFYAFESFRKGDYSIKVEKEGYYSIEVEESIWEARDLRYVMTEIIYGINNLYVSSTGWAMWEGQGPGPVPPHGGDEFEFAFDSGLDGWTNIDADGDGEVFYPSSQAGNHSVLAITSHSGAGHLMSESFCNAGGVLYPNNFLVSPQMYNIGGSSVLSFWCCAQDASYAAEHFGVAISTTGNTNAADFTTIQEWTLTAKGGNEVPAAATRNGKSNREGNWYQFTCDLSAYAGQQVWIAIRHFNVSDMFILCLDDMALTTGAKSDERHLEYYKVMCTSIDGQPIFNADTEHPFCQLATDELVQGEHYICKVAAMYSTGMSDWTECEWAYIPCDNYAGTTEGVIEEEPAGGNHFSWTYPTGPGPVPPGPGDEFTFGFEEDLAANGWTIQQLNETTWERYEGATGFGAAPHEGSYHMWLHWAYGDQDEWLITPSFTVPANGNLEFWTYATLGSTYGDHYYVKISTDGGSTWNVLWDASAQPAGTNYYTSAINCDLSAYAGQTAKIAWQGYMADGLWYAWCIDDITVSGGREVISFDGRQWTRKPVVVTEVGAPVANSKAGDSNNRAAWDLIGSMSAYEPAQYGVATDGVNIYTCNWGYSSAQYNFCKYDMSGNFIEGFNISGCGTIRDLDYDGQFFYGGANSSVLYTIDLANHVLVNTTNTGCSAIRHCSYDPQRDGFWVGGWDDLMLIDRNGSVIQTAPAPSSCAGSGFYEDENGNGHVYLWCEPQSVYDYNIANNNISLISNLTNVPGWDGSSTAGGAFVGQYGDKIAFFCNIQQSPNVIGIYELRDAGSPLPPTPGDNAVIGAMIFRDGEWLAQVDYPTSEYTDLDEYGHHEYCVRLIYAGTNFLPEGNLYYSMSCEECIEIGDGEHCPAGADIRGEYVWNEGGEFGALVSWGEQVEPIAEWLYYDNGTNEDAIGLTGGGSFYWGVMFPATSLSAYNGCSLTKVCMYDYTAHTGKVIIYQGGNTAPGTPIHQQNYSMTGSSDYVEIALSAPLAIDVTQNLWVVFNNDNGDYVAACCANTGDANGRWISLDGATWEDVASYGLTNTWQIRAFVTNMAKGAAPVAIEAPALNGTANGVLAKAGVSTQGNRPAYAPRAAQIVEYNVYRSTNNADYDLIATVEAVEGQDYYEHFDEVPAGAYYYQVTAVYDNGCESDPALAEGNHANNYVIVAVTGIEENSGIALYPNPTSGNVKIEAVGMNHITVVSALGQVVYDVEVSCDEYELNMAQFNAGIYMVRISSESGVSTQRVTVVR